MTRAAAETLIGTRVQAWTAANGIYVGTLVEVRPTRPWRGRVLITGVLAAACPWEVGGKERQGFQPGATIEVGGINIKPTDEEGFPDYLQALRVQLAQFESYSRPIGNSVAAIRRRIAEHEARHDA